MKVERIERSKHKQERVLVYLEGGTFSGSPRASFCVSAYMWGWTFRPRLWYNYKKAARAAKRACARPI